MTTTNAEKLNPQFPYNQLQPDLKYTIYLGGDMSAAKLADVFVVGAGHMITLVDDEKRTYECKGDSETGGTEFWWYSNDSFKGQKMDDLMSIYMDVSDLKDKTTDHFNWAKLIQKKSSVIKPEGEGWSRPPKPYSEGTSYYFSFNNFGLELNVGTDATSGMQFLNGVQWYQPGSKRPGPIGGDGFKGSWIKVSGFPDTYLAQSSI